MVPASVSGGDALDLSFGDSLDDPQPTVHSTRATDNTRFHVLHHGPLGMAKFLRNQQWEESPGGI
jgi:hypothetical protein